MNVENNLNVTQLISDCDSRYLEHADTADLLFYPPSYNSTLKRHKKATLRWLLISITFILRLFAQVNLSLLLRLNQTYSYHRHWFYHNESANVALHEF